MDILPIVHVSCGGDAREEGSTPLECGGCDTPGGKHFCRGVAGDSAVVGPIHHASRLFGAQESFVRGDADAAEIEAIGIPAGLDGRVCLGESVGVQSAGFVKEFEAVVVEMHKRTTQCPRQVPSPLPVPAIDALIDPARIVKEREERHDFGVGTVFLRDMKPVFHHPRPVGDSVMSTLR